MLKEGTIVGEFQILRLLGKGGMGEVYEAQQTHPERRVALKVLAPWLAENDEALKRFWQEAEVPAKLDHPAVVRIFKTGKFEGTAYYVMQLVNGISLAKLISRANEPTPPTQSFPSQEERTPPNAEATVDDPSAPKFEPDPPILREYLQDRYRTLARLGIQAARALAWTHKQGYLHRDIKPSNLMVDHHNQLYLVDFGLTRALDSSMTTRTGTLVGTPYYMSPEQAVGQPLDPRSDIFSLGVSLYQLASQGRGPYKSSRDNSDAVLREVRAGEMLPIRAMAPDIPPALEAILQRAIHPDPTRRYQKAAELADDLEKFLAPPVTTPAPATSSSAGLRFAFAGFAVVALLILGAAAAHLSGLAPWREPIDNRPPNPVNNDAGKKPEPIAKIDDAKKPDPPKPPTLREFFKRDRPVRTAIPLLRADNQPAKHKQLLAPANYWAMSKEIIVASNKEGHKPGMLALDDPGDSNFEFAVEMKHWDQNINGKHDLGLFFGWREDLNDPLERPRFFAVQLDPRVDNQYPHGRLLIGSWMFEEPKGARGGMSEQNLRGLFSPKEGPKGIMPLPAPRDQRFKFYRVYVRVVEQKITAGVEDEPPLEFDAAWMMNNDKWLRTFTLDPHGALGIWTRNGQACFKNATVMTLAKSP